MMEFEVLKDRGELVRFLFCCGLVEEKVSNAYRSLASRLDDVVAKILLEYIADDSLKHSKILLGVSNHLGVRDVDLEECRKIVGLTSIRIIEDAEKVIAGENKVSMKEIAFEFDNLIDLERYFGEEYFSILQLKLLEALLEFEEVELGLLKEVLEYIIEDEKRHEKILQAIKMYASQK
jgi:rubrerythrin